MKNPAGAQKDLQHAVTQYLEVALPVKASMSNEMRTAFDKFLETGAVKGGLDFVKAPFIEPAREYKACPYSFAELASDKGGNILHPEVAKAFARYLVDNDEEDPAGIYPYEHQYRSLKAVGKDDKNLVVCTGTGSGKTECFLLPLVDAIYRQRVTAGTDYHKHVRALILYPMNALVIDQIKRLRKLLRYLPEVTFGQYIGTTEKAPLDSDVPDALVTEGKGLLTAAEESQSGYQPVNALSNEIRHRSEWDDNPADILVTNYAMLERLLLLPQRKCHFFDKCWDFIVIDEAHSYSGSVGTEIAWLMRRLEHRLHNVEPGKKLHFLATSATLSNGTDKDKREKALEFVSKLFPAEADSFHYETGEFVGAVRFDNPPIPFSDSIAHFKQTNNKLIGDTIAYENRLVQWRAVQSDMGLLKQVLASGGTVSTERLFALRDFFSFNCKCPIPEELHDDLLVTETMKYLARLVLTKRNRLGGGKDGDSDESLAGMKSNWRYFLHDVTLKARSVLPHDEITIKDRSGTEKRVKNPKGNRLDVFEIWRSMAANDYGHARVHYLVFYYMYIALGELVRENELDLDISKFALQLSDAALMRLKKIVDDNEAERCNLEEMRKRFDEEWRKVLPLGGAEMEYKERLYRICSVHPDYLKYEEIVANGEPMDINHFAATMGVTPEELQDFFELCGIGRVKGRRNALAEVRYHQVVRDISDIGVYFEEGDPSRPHFVRSMEEFANGGKGKIFTLGLCRDCGQPYLLGYANDILECNRVMKSEAPAFIYRAQTLEFSSMHAFALPEPLSCEDAEDGFPKDPDDIWLNLCTGAVLTGTEPHGDMKGWVKAHWMVPPEKEEGIDSGSSYIPRCPRCGTKQSTPARYGIITPYEAVGSQYKIAVLDAFTSLTEEDSDERVRKGSTAGGRKVLAFSDSRSMAAKLASEFETTKERRLMDKILLDLVTVASKEKVLSSENQALLREKLDNARMFEQYGSPLPSKLRDEIDRLKCGSDTKVQPVVDLFLHSEDANRYEEEVNRVHYLQLLDWETPSGDSIPVEDVTRFLVLKSLRDSSRQGLSANGLIELRSKRISEETQWTELLKPSIGICDSNDAKNVCQKIFHYLVLKKKIILPPNSFERPDGRGTYLDNFERNGITDKGFWTCDKSHFIFRSILFPFVREKLAVLDPTPALRKDCNAWLKIAFGYFVDDHKWGILGCPDTAGAYNLEFYQLCSDLEIWRQKEYVSLSEVQPYVIEEHTAQIDGTTGAAYQKAFSEGTVNILSCSTTFEMGIDVGGLNNVFLGNMPPASSNYRQRAGRAGRRPGASAYILSLAGRSAHDRNFYDDVKSLFWGKIAPPAVYLEKPVFAARHFRAEALHDFLEYIDGKLHAGEMKGKRQAKWEKISLFLLGWYSRKNKTDKKNKSEKVAGGSYCDKYGAMWLSERDSSLLEQLKNVKGFESFRKGVGDAVFDRMYSPARDLLFQLMTREGDLVQGPDAYQFYQNMGGCRLPERDASIADEDVNPVESQNLKRMALKERVYHQLFLQNDRIFNKEPYEHLWPANDVQGTVLKLAQVRTLRRRTIDVLSESCILPRYGFPVDEIELKLDKTELYGDVELKRPLQLGLFEYAPGQTITANKRTYLSRSAAFLRYPNDNTPNTLADRLTLHAKFCRRCHKVYDGLETKCPQCGRPLVDPKCKFITPEVFYADKSLNGHAIARFNPRGEVLVRWGGVPILNTHVPGLAISTAESSDRMMQYINTNRADKGFPNRLDDEGPNTRRFYYVHEIQTNVAIWQLKLTKPFSLVDPHQIPSDDFFDGYRLVTACMSAAYALRRSCAEVLSVSTRDIGVLPPNIEGDTAVHPIRFVFFDTAAGGGGNALALTMKDENDSVAADRIKAIILHAVDLLETDTDCSLQDGDTPEMMPVPINVYQTLGGAVKAHYRPACACYSCLKDFDNQREHARLDKFDAIEILKMMMDESMLTAAPPSDKDSEIEWASYDGISPLHVGPHYRLKDGSVCRWAPGKFCRDAVDAVEVEE